MSLLATLIMYLPIFLAEKALATLHGRPIPGHKTTVCLSLSPFPHSQSPYLLPQPGAATRLVKQLPAGYNDSQLYDLFRPFGPLVSVHTQSHFGKDVGVVQFWVEEDAKLSDVSLHCAEVEGNNIALQAYQPGRPEFNASTQVPLTQGSPLSIYTPLVRMHVSN